MCELWGGDGETAWGRIKARNFGMRIAAPGGQALCKMPMEGPDRATRGNSSVNFRQATHIGFGKWTPEHRFIGEEGIVTSRRLMRLPEEKKWSIELLEKIQVLPWGAARRSGSTKLALGETVGDLIAEAIARVARRL